jgi:hypothetical protein
MPKYNVKAVLESTIEANSEGEAARIYFDAVYSMVRNANRESLADFAEQFPERVFPGTSITNYSAELQGSQENNADGVDKPAEVV